MAGADTRIPEFQTETNLRDRVAVLERLNQQLRSECQEILRSKTGLQAQESLMREVFDRNPTFSILLDKDFNVVAYNAVAAKTISELLGIQIEIGKPAIEFTFPEGRDQLIEAARKALAGEVVVVHRSIPGPDRMRWLRHTFTPIASEETGFTGVLITSESEDDKHQAETELQRQLRYWNVLMDTLPQPLFEMDLSGRITFANRAILQLFGYSREDLDRGVTALDVVAPEDHERAWQDALQVFRREPYEPTEYTARRKDGTRFPALLYATATTEGDRVCGVRGIVLDISKMKQAEQEIHKLSKVVESAPQAIIICSSSGLIEYANAAAAREVGVGRPEDLHGRSAYDFADESSSEQLRKEIIPQLLAGRNWAGTFNAQRADRTTFPVDAVLASVPDQQGQTQQWFGIFQDATRRLEAERALRESEQRFRSMADTAPVLIWMAGVDRHTYYFNRTWLNFTGRTLSQEYGKGWMAGVHPDDIPRCRDAYHNAFASRQPFHVEYRLKHADGTYHWVLDTGQPRFTNDGSLAGYIGSCVDITDRKRAEESVAESERRYRSLYNRTPVMLHSIDSEGRLLSVSDYWLEVMGYDRREVIGRPSTDFLTPESREYAQNTVLPEFFRTGSCKNVSYQMVKKNGEIIDVLLSATLERGDKSRVNRSLAVMVDVTEQNRTERALQVKTAELTAILEALPDLYFQLDREGRIRGFHAPNREDLYVPPEQFENRHYTEYLPVEVTRQIDAAIQEVRRTGKVASFEYQLNIRGEVRDYESRMVPLGNEEMIVLVRDITARKRSEARFAQLNECFLSFGSDPVTNINHLVSVCGQLLGATCALYNRVDGEQLETIAGWNVPDDFKWRDRAEGHLCTDVIRGGSDVPFVVRNLQNTAYLHTDPNVKHYGLQTYVGMAVKCGDQSAGSLCVVYQRDFAPDAEAERIMGIIAAAIAVEESRSDVLRSLRESDERFRAIANYTHGWENWIDPNGKLIWVNPGVERISGYTPDECLAMPDFPLPLIHPDDRQRIQTELERALSGERGSDVDFRIIRKDGAVIWVSVSWLPISASDGTCLGHRSSIRDIADRKRAQDTLLASERRYRLVTEQTGQMVYDWDVATGEIFWSGAIELITGFTNEEYSKVDITSWEKMIHPDDRAQATRQLQEALQGSGRYEVVYRLRRKDETYVYVEDNGVFIRDTNGSAVRMFGTMKNITERRRAEEALRQSEESYRGLFNAVAEAIYIQDADGKFLDVNRGAEEMYGYPREYFIGKTPEFLSAPGMNDMQATIEKVMKTFAGEPQRFEWWGKRANGEIFPKDVRLYPGTYFGQKVVIAWSMDISDRKAAERAIRESEERYRVLAETAFDGISISEGGRIQFASDRFAEIFGYQSAADLVGKSVQDLVAPNELERISAHTQSDNSKPFETVCLRRDGTCFPAEFCCRTVRQNSKEVRISAVRDLTERRRMDEALRARSRLEATAILAGGIAHDFNNLMAAVLGNAELLSMQFGDRPEAQEMLEVICKTALRAGDLAQQMLAFARGGKYQPQPLNLNETIVQTLRLQERTFPPRIYLERKLQPSLWIVEADANQMSQVLLNLITNALEATEGMGRITVETQNVDITEIPPGSVGTLSPGPHVVLTVSDTGCGMPPDVRERVFEPFYSTKAQGRGLGLAAVYGIVRNHGGQVTVDSEVEHGSTFRVYLPAKPSARAKTPSSQTATPALPMGTETILIADDEEAILEVTKGFFERLGYRVLTARDGAEAIVEYESHADEVRLAVLDLAMPAYTGAEVCKYLRSTGRQVSVILSSGFDVNDYTQTSFDLSNCVFVQKPFQLAALAKQIRNLLDQMKAES